MKYDVVIIGAGPAGLSCAEVTASRGLSTLVLEKNKTIGKKICAGGITWNGLLRKVSDISQKSFSKQYVFTRRQNVIVKAAQPIIATVNREELGRYMAAQAIDAGADILTSSRVHSIQNSLVEVHQEDNSQNLSIEYEYLVGADGSTSAVRKHLGLPTEKYGIGINYQVPLQREKMEWHLDSQLFKSGYGWIFPHRETTSIGAYVDADIMTARTLNNNLHSWSRKQGIDLTSQKPRAERINFDYRGESFGRIFLTGDAAGLTSGLTGEGIYPAILSGQYVGNKIYNPLFICENYSNLLKNHNRHARAVHLAGKSEKLSSVLAEITGLLLRTKLLKFTAAEMAR